MTTTDACCATTVEPALDDATIERIAATSKALGDVTRVRLLSLIAASDGGEACICDLTDPVGLSQATVSHHMRILADAGLVTRDQRGRWAYYAIAPGSLDAAAASLRAI